MTTVREIERFLFTLAPADMKESWDNVGLLCGHEAQEVGTVLVALDPFPDVAEEAISCGAQLIVTHHPIIFGSIQSVNDRTVTGRTLLTLIGHGIAAVNMHTNLDSAPGGVNDILAARLGLQNVRVLAPAGTDGQGREYGLGRYGEHEPTSLQAFLPAVRDSLGCGGLRYADGGREVRKVAVGGGACGEFMGRAIELGCDTFVTADLKYNQFADAAALGLNLIDAGHFPTEDPVCGYLADRLRAAFPNLRVILSKTHGDCVNFSV